MNILLTNYCNRSCPYCFAKDRLAPESARQNLSLENIEKILAFLKDYGSQDISLLGGEPTLNPQFVPIVQRLQSAGYHILLFSNALMPPEVVDFIASPDLHHIRLVINVNHPDDTPSGQWEHIEGVLKRLGAKAGLGFNIYQPHPRLDFLLDLTRKYNLRPDIRLGIAQPILGATNQYLPMQEYFTLAPQVVEFATRCDEFDVSLVFDCGFVLCMFDDAQLGRLRRCNASLTFNCWPPIDIGPDLQIWHCFPLSRKYPTRLEDFKQPADLERFYTEKFQPLRLFGSLPRCGKCKYLRRKQCNGGCLAHKFHSFHVTS